MSERSNRRLCRIFGHRWDFDKWARRFGSDDTPDGDVPGRLNIAMSLRIVVEFGWGEWELGSQSVEVLEEHTYQWLARSMAAIHLPAGGRVVLISHQSQEQGM